MILFSNMFLLFLIKKNDLLILFSLIKHKKTHKSKSASKKDNIMKLIGRCKKI